MPSYSIGNNDFAVIDSKSDKLILQYKGQALVSFDLITILSDVPLNNNYQIILSPNPAKGSLKVLNTENLVIMSIIADNLTGNNFPLQLVNSEINISHLANGKYFLRLTLANNSILNFNFIKE